MPPAKRTHEDPHSLKEKLHALPATSARGRRNGATNVPHGSNLKEVMSSTADNASTNSGQKDYKAAGMKWSSQDASVLRDYRRAYRLDTPSSFKNPLSHVVLGSGIGQYSPTMSRPRTKRRVHKDQLALAVRKNFNALGVNESDVIIDLLYKVKNNGADHVPAVLDQSLNLNADKEFRVHFAPQRK
ncbi:hypothetical protein BDV95DRAFT_601785 [Massariosphaeria phaeospora]|uniref:Histone deacetylase complex subunit SAP30 Sin3 binding domain-containing protein n=1 Tax=Massariosphaeria phaeospora TaxID=100035 RepID=A0A7C8MH37_9PLEO|nr:hypothetical protein BDV95DRAFT_601785 [Massariosphaeria phaeospora]